jgi:hypothetical protein
VLLLLLLLLLPLLLLQILSYDHWRAAHGLFACALRKLLHADSNVLLLLLLLPVLPVEASRCLDNPVAAAALLLLLLQVLS